MDAVFSLQQSGSDAVFSYQFTVAVPTTTRAGGRTYVIRGKRYYDLTNEQLAYLLAHELIDVQRSDIRVQYGNKARRITRGDFAALVKQSKASQEAKDDAMEWDDEEAAMLLL